MKRKKLEDDIILAKYISFMKKALYHRRLNYLKSNLLKKEILVSDDEWIKLSYSDNLDYSFFNSSESDIEFKIKIAIEKLPQKQKQVIDLYYYKDMKIRIIAKRLNTNENAIKQLKSRAIKNLKKNMMEEGS